MTPAGRGPDAIRWLKWAVFVLGLSIVASVGFGVGSSNGADTHVVTGQAYLSGDHGTATVSGVAYRFEVFDGMTWYDDHGLRTEGIPPCMTSRPGSARIRFGYATAHGRDNNAWPVVTWVQCVT